MAGYTGSIPITGFIAPTDTLDTYPVIDPLFGIDGLRNVATLNDMYAIPALRRRVGMVVGVQITGNYYKLKSAPWAYNSSDWDPFLTSSGAGSGGSFAQYYITSGTVSVPQYSQYLLYGSLTIANNGALLNDGQVVLINGTLSFSGNGTYSGSGTLTYLSSLIRATSSVGPGPNFGMTQPNVKYAISFSCSASVPLTVTHSLNTTDITYSVREGNNFITANVEINNSNSIILTTNANITNGRINIIG